MDSLSIPIAFIERTISLIGGWREVIASIDDLPKNEALGKAMYACLDQIDDWKVMAKKIIDDGKELTNG